jgi:hypothetical protein
MEASYLTLKDCQSLDRSRQRVKSEQNGILSCEIGWVSADPGSRGIHNQRYAEIRNLQLRLTSYCLHYVLDYKASPIQCISIVIDSAIFNL